MKPLFWFFFWRSAKKRKTAVSNNMRPTKSRFREDNCSMNSCKNNPTKTAGNIESKIFNEK